MIFKFAISLLITVMSILVTQEDLSLLHLLIDAISPLLRLLILFWEVPLQVPLVQERQKQLKIWEEILDLELLSITVLNRWISKQLQESSLVLHKLVSGDVSMSSIVSVLKCYLSYQLKLKLFSMLCV